MLKNLKKNLQSVNKELKALAKQVDKIVVAVDKLEKPKTAKKPKAIAVKKPAAKKLTKLTATDTVMRFINRTKKGVGTAALMEKTGFNEKKIHNVVYKLKKQGKIKSVAKGVYLKA